MVNSMFYYLNIFFIYSILGFFFESSLERFITPTFNSGILYGPWTFIYAIAILVLMFLSKNLKKLKLPKWLEIFIFYILACIFMAFIEYSGGMLIEKIMHRVYWDYTNLKFNYGHYIALEISLLWGFFATVVYYLLFPLIDKIVKKIPKYLTIIFIIFFSLDIIATIIN